MKKLFIFLLLVSVFSSQSFGSHYFRMYKTGVSVNFFRPTPDGWWKAANNLFYTGSATFEEWPSIGPIFLDDTMSQSVFYTIDRIENWGVGSDTYRDVFLIITTNEPEEVSCRYEVDVNGPGTGSVDFFLDFGGAYANKNFSVSVGSYKTGLCGIHPDNDLPTISYSWNYTTFDSATQSYVGVNSGSGSASFFPTGEFGDPHPIYRATINISVDDPYQGIDPESLPPPTNSVPPVPDAPDDPDPLDEDPNADPTDYGDLQDAVERALAAQGAGDSGIIDAINNQGYGIKNKLDDLSFEFDDSGIIGAVNSAAVDASSDSSALKDSVDALGDKIEEGQDLGIPTSGSFSGSVEDSDLPGDSSVLLGELSATGDTSIFSGFISGFRAKIETFFSLNLPDVGKTDIFSASLPAFAGVSLPPLVIDLSKFSFIPILRSILVLSLVIATIFRAQKMIAGIFK